MRKTLMRGSGVLLQQCIRKTIKLTSNDQLAWGHMHGDRGMNTKEESSRLLALCNVWIEKAMLVVRL